MRNYFLSRDVISITDKDSIMPSPVFQGNCITVSLISLLKIIAHNPSQSKLFDQPKSTDLDLLDCIEQFYTMSDKALDNAPSIN